MGPFRKVRSVICAPMTYVKSVHAMAAASAADCALWVLLLWVDMLVPSTGGRYAALTLASRVKGYASPLQLMYEVVAAYTVCFFFTQGGGVWVLQRDGSMFVIGEEAVAPLLVLCQR